MAASITSAMRTQVSQLYVSLFGRAPDGEGLGFWAGALAGGKSISTVAQEMFDSTPARAYYPSFLTNQEIVEKFYINVLGRTADADGLAFWLKAMNATGATKGGVIASMIDAVNSYSGSDAAGVASKALFVNKVAVAEYYGLQNLAVGSSTILAGVTSAASSVDTAKAAILNPTVAGQTFTLTTSSDNSIGGAGNDTFSASVNFTTTSQSTFTAGDSITGGAGDDTFSVTVEGDVSASTAQTLAAASVSGVENIKIRNLSADEVLTVNADRFVGATNFVNDRSTVGVTFTNIGSADVTVIGDGSSTIGTTTIDVGATSVTDAFTLNLQDGTKGTAAITVSDSDAKWTSATINSTGAANTVGAVGLASGSTVTSLTINAAKGLTASSISGFKSTGATVTIAGATTTNVSIGTLDSAVTSVDASGLTAAGLTATTAVATAAIVGGQGNDSITIGVGKTTGGTTALGAGVDTVITTADSYIDTAAEGALITGAETLNISNTSTINTTFADRTQDVSLVSGITKVGLSTLALTGSTSDDTDTAVSVSFTKLSSSVSDLTISGLSYTDGSDSYDDSVAATVSASRATDTTADSLAITLGSASAETGVGMAATTDALTLSITVDNEETLSIASTGAANYVTALSAADATSLTLTGSKSLTIASISAAILKTVDASAMTGAFIMGAAANNLADTITGGSGNDTLIGGTGADSLIGNAGVDSITAGAGNDYVSGGAGNDALLGEDGNDTILGGDGVDTITGGSGMDNLSGGDGNDTFIVAAQADFVSSVGSVETVDGGAGALDVLQFSATGGDVTLAAASLAGLVGIEKIEYLETDNALSVTLTDAVMTSNGNTTLTIDADTVTTGTISVSASTLSSTNIIIIDADTTTYSGGGTIALGSGADRVILDADALDNDFTSLSGGAGTDTLTISLQTTNSAVTMDADITSFEVVNFTNGDNYYVVTRDTNVASGATMTVNGDSLTSTLRFDGSLETNGKFVITGGADADTLAGGSGADSITGGSGSDSLTGGAGNDTISGGDDADSIDGGDGNDVIDAGDGNDASIVGGAGSDNLSGGSGNDTFLVGTLSHFTSLSGGVETVSGGAGNDKLSIGVTGTIAASDLLGISSIETIAFTSDDAHTVTFTDAVMAANGNATMTIDASAMLTTAVLTFNASAVTSGYSFVLDASSTASNAANDITLGAGNDNVKLDVAALDSAYVTLEGGSGTDTLTLTLSTPAASGVTTIDSNITGFETIAFTSSAGLADDYNIKTASATVASGATMTVSGGSLTGFLKFDGSAETNGYFNITSGGGDDSITGGTLADTISTGSGADTITGGLGADNLTGGAGNDVFVYANVSQSGGTSVDTITDWTSAADKLQVTLEYSALSAALDINAVRLGTGAATLSTIQDGLSGKRGEYQYNVETSQLVINFNNDNLITSADYKIGLAAGSTATATVADGDINFSISGGSGADSIIAGGGADTISGGAGANTIDGGSGNDSITGGIDADSIVGGSGADTISGGSGADTITGGAGNDAITLGDGADTIIFGTATTNGSDTVSDYVLGTDILNVAALMTSGSLANGVSSTTITLASTGALRDETANAISVASNRLYVAEVADAQSLTIDTVAHLVTALADTGQLDAVDLSSTSGAKNVLVLKTITGLTTYVYAYVGDGTAGVLAAELTLIGTLTSASDDVSITTSYVYS